MAGKLIICFITAFALIQVNYRLILWFQRNQRCRFFRKKFPNSFVFGPQPFNTLPAADQKQDVIYRNSKGEYYTSDGVILTDQIPIYWRHKNVQEPPKEHVVIVEPTITYTRQAEYSTTQASPSTTFRGSPKEGQSDFRPYDGRAETAAVAYYPYYIRAASSDRSDIEERRRIEESKRVVIDASDPAYQRFIPRDGAVRDDRGHTWYYYPDTRQTSPPPPPPQPTLSSKSSVRFYFRK